ncbi:MAG: hypothetical protein C5B58_11725 [Acidobacteria bacterium]|nr:MAG: hypothetical protein C5B58_11725 [Acidobacteriota bacterium]
MTKRKAKKKESKIHKACLAILYKTESGEMTGVVVPFYRSELRREKGKSIVGEFDTPEEAFATLEARLKRRCERMNAKRSQSAK